jgi:Fe-S-cluster containining protein
VIKEKFARGVEHFNKIDWFERMQALAPLKPPKDPNYQRKEVLDLAMEYFYENIPCPFLEEGSCSIHPDRPLACREYLVTTPAENCSRPTAETVRVMNLLIKPSTSLRALGRTKNLAELAVLPLIRALDFAEKYPEQFVEKTGERWAADFFSRLSHQEIPKKGIRPKKPTTATRKLKRRKHR